MAGKEFTTKSGAKLFVSYASLEDGMALVKATNKVMLDLQLFGKEEPEPTMRLFGDAEVYACYLRCAEKATYNGRKLDAALFGDPKSGDAACSDTFDIFNDVVSFNNSRFFPAASSASSTPPPAA